MKNIFGIINLGKSFKYDLKKIFYDEFSSVKNIKHSFISENIIFYSEKIQENHTHIFAYRNKLILWNTVEKNYIVNTDNFINKSSNLEKLDKNKIIQVSDSPSLLILKNEETIKLISSTTGWKCFYYIIKDQLLIFADHIGLIREATKLDVNMQGLIEIIRFGANHGETTLLSGLKRIPFSHSLIVNGRNIKLKCYKWKKT